MLAGATGHLIVEVRPVSALTRLSDAEVRRLWGSSAVTWVQATRIGLSVFVDRKQVLVWISRLGDGAPRPGVRVEMGSGDTRAISDETGVTRLPLADADPDLVVARAGADAAFLPLLAAQPPGDTEADHADEDCEVRFSVFSDRTLYRAGETVAVKGWLRRAGGGTRGDVSLLLAAAATHVVYRMADAWGSGAVVEGRAPLSPVGGFHLQVELPREAPPGWSTIHLRPVGGTLEARDVRHAHRIMVQEHRRTECEVEVEIDLVPDGAGGHAEATVTAHCGGRALAAAEVEWSVTASADDVHVVELDGVHLRTRLPSDEADGV